MSSSKKESMAKAKTSKPAVKKVSLKSRPPVVGVLGHIDHGKTTLLDFIRQSKVAPSEAGGITQHIGAYQTKVKVEGGRLITFIDTPGHEAFAKMRSRGAKAADMALLVISAKDGLKPQTQESIVYIKEAKIPFIVVINKIDLFKKKSAREVAVRKIEKQLKKLNLLVEKEGGEIVTMSVSAKTGENVDELLEMIILLAELKELRGNPEGPFQGVIIDSQIDPRRGVLATILVRDGSLKVGDQVKTEGVRGKMRAMFDENGQKVTLAGPSKPVRVLGFEKAPPMGGVVAPGESGLTSLSAKTSAPHTVLEAVEECLSPDEEEKLRVILKTDTLGTKEAILAALGEKVEIIMSGIGDVSESDVFLAKTSKALILGFKVALLPQIKKLAQDEGVKIKSYEIIYKLLEEVEDAASFLKEGEKEKVLGRGQIIVLFEAKKKKIAGVKVVEGRMVRGDRIKILREEEEIGEARIVSLRQQKEDIHKAEMGEECGLGFSKELDFRAGDSVKSIG